MAIIERKSAASPGPPTLWKGFLRMFGLSEGYRTRLFLAIALILANSAIGLVIPLGIRELLDSVFQNGERALLNRLALGLATLFLLQAFVSFWGRYSLSWTGERIVADFRERIYAHLHGLSLHFFNNEKTGELISRLTSDATAVQVAVTRALAEFVAVGLRLGGSAVLIVMINWRLSILIIVVAPASAIVTRYFGRRLRQLSRNVQDHLAVATSIAEEALSSIRVVMAFGRTSHETRRYNVAIESLFGAAKQKALLSALYSAFMGLLFFSSVTAIFWYGGMEVLSGRLSVGDLVASLFYALNISQGIRNLASVYNVLCKASGASERLFEILEIERDIEDSPDAVDLPAVQGRIRFESLSFGYEPGRPVLHDIQIDVQQGQIVALVGPSGAGKTTLLKLIPRFFDPDFGRILIDEYDLRSVTLESLRRQIALVSQDVVLFNDTIGENIRYGRLDATDDEVKSAARAANAHGFISSLPNDYATVVGERGVRLSGGQKQRVAIARALLKEARILLLDEATSSLDSETEMKVKQSLEHLMQDCTSFIVAHRLATVRDADRIVVMEGGRVVDGGTHSELAARSGLYREFATQQSVATIGGYSGEPFG